MKIIHILAHNFTEVFELSVSNQLPSPPNTDLYPTKYPLTAGTDLHWEHKCKSDFMFVTITAWKTNKRPFLRFFKSHNTNTITDKSVTTDYQP